MAEGLNPAFWAQETRIEGRSGSMRGRPGSDVRAYFAAQPQSPLTRQPVHRDRIDPGPPRRLANVSVARREQVVAGRIDKAAVMAGDAISEDLPVLGKGLDSGGLVVAHQPRVASHVGAEYCRQFTFGLGQTFISLSIAA